MKLKCYLCVLFVIASLSAFAQNSIETITTLTEAQQFVKQIYKPLKPYYFIDSITFQCYDGCCRSSSDSIIKSENQNLQQYINTHSIKLWYKADFDNNGYTDLLVSARGKLLIVMASSNNTYEVKRIELNHYNNCYALLPSIIKDGNETYIKLHYIKAYVGIVLLEANKYYNKPIEDELFVYKFTEFVHYNASPSTRNITNIQFIQHNTAYSNAIDINITPSGGWYMIVNPLPWNLFTGPHRADLIFHYIEPYKIEVKTKYGKVASADISTFKQLLNYIEYSNYLVTRISPFGVYKKDHYATLIVQYEGGEKVKYNFNATNGQEGMVLMKHIYSLCGVTIKDSIHPY